MSDPKHIHITHSIRLFPEFLFEDQLLSGKSQGPDPNDVPPVAAQGVSMGNAAANVQECETIEEEEEDSSEYEESSDEQQ